MNIPRAPGRSKVGGRQARFTPPRVTLLIADFGGHGDAALLAEVQRILALVMNKQWDYDAGVDRLKSDSRPAS